MKKLMLLMLLPLLIVACAGIPEPSKRDLILGSWAASFEGQNMTLIYDAEDITVQEFGISFPYEWINDDEIKLDAMGQEVVSRVDFITPDQMRQVSDQGEQILTRVN